jgi:hypothetical protein
VQPPLARRRLRLSFAVTVTAVGGSLLMSAGTSSSATAPAVAAFVGPVAPVAVPPAPRPLVRTDGPLLPPPVRSRLAPVPRPMGPPAATRVVVGPTGFVGPGSPPHQVRAMQRLLNARGAQLRVDGAWGPATTRAVQRVQAEAGLPATGRVGPRTAAALRD